MLITESLYRCNKKSTKPQLTTRYRRCSDVKVRLSGGNSTTEGRLEVYYDGKWGTVCDDEFSNIDAGVVCNSLGFGFVLYFSTVVPS